MIRFHCAFGVRDGGLERGGERVPVRVGVEGDELREAREGVFGDVLLFMGESPFYFKPSDTFPIPKDCVAEAVHARRGGRSLLGRSRRNGGLPCRLERSLCTLRCGRDP